MRRHYVIRGSKPGSNPNYPRWRENVVCHVLADNLPKAVELTLATHPDIELHSVQHEGEIDIIQQGEAS